MAKIVLTHYLSCVSLRNEYNTFIALRDGVARNGCRTEVRRLHRRRWRCADERHGAGGSGGQGGRAGGGAAESAGGDCGVCGALSGLGIDLSGDSLCDRDDSTVVHGGDSAFVGRADFAGVVHSEEIAADLGADSSQRSDWRAFLFAWTWVATLGGVARTVGAGGAIDCDRADYCVRAFISCRAAMAGERDFAGLAGVGLLLGR